jgi:hypothetical protein
MSQESSFSRKLASGAIAGVFGTTVIFPLDIIKTRLQANPQLYKGILNCGNQIIKNGGMRGLYRGLMPNLVGIIPEKGIKLAVNDFAREFWGKRLNCSPNQLPIQYGIISGATAGFCQVIATNPMEMVKIQLQLKTQSAWKVVKSLGLKGLYKNSTATLGRDVPFSIIFFTTVSVLKEFWTIKNEPTPLSVVFGSGIIAGGFAAAAVTPMDCIKTKLQMIPTDGSCNPYTGWRQCFTSVYKTQGVKGLFRGVGPRVLIVSVF